MKCERRIVKIYLLLFVFETVKGDACYGAQFSEEIIECADFQNENLQCDSLSLNTIEGSESELGFTGTLKMNTEITSEITAEVDIFKILDIGKEFMYHMQGDICSNLKEEDTPWYPIVHSMNINSCPIKAASYDIKDMSINISHAKEFMTHEMVGEYVCELSLMNGLTKMSCHEFAVSVYEYQC